MFGKKFVITTLMFVCGVSHAIDYNQYQKELTKQIHEHFDKSVCNKVIGISGAKDGSANIAECDTKIYTGNPEYFRITNDSRFPFIRCSSLGSWESYSAKKCRGHTR